MFSQWTVLQSEISEALREIADGSTAEPLQAVATLLPAFLRIGIQNDDWLGWCADNSYLHVNGFDKLVIAVLPNHAKLRVHLWAKDFGFSAEDIHNHRWNFASLLIKGQLAFRFYEETPSGKTYFAYHYGWDALGRTYSLVPAGSATLQPYFNCVIGQRSAYFIDHAVLHRVAPQGHDTILTLIAQTPPLKESTRVFSKSQKGSDELIRHPPRFSIKLIADKLELIARLIEEE